jgi:NADP-dependent 3-hydroxy acid dehydrogenase YdfG
VRTWAGKRYWLIGASDGLGAALARRLSAAGVELILSARSEAALAALAAEMPGRVEVLPLDVTDGSAVQRAVEKVGHMDGIVYLAGVYWPMDASGWNVEQSVAMAEVNFVGALRVMGAAMPMLLGPAPGHVVITGSLSGYRGLPGAIGYAASKAGVMTLAESMYMDLKKTEVDVQLINPGFIKTRLTEKNEFKMPMIMSPEKAADVMFRHMSGDRFRCSFPAPFSWLFRAGQILPDRVWNRLFA